MFFSRTLTLEGFYMEIENYKNPDNLIYLCCNKICYSASVR